MSLVWLALIAIAAAAVPLIAVWLVGRRHADEKLEAARIEAGAVRRGAEIEAAANRYKAETEAREQALELRAEAEAELAAEREALDQADERVGRKAAELAEFLHDLEARVAEVDERSAAVDSLRDRARGLEDDVERRRQAAALEIETRAGISATAIAERMSQRWLEDAQAATAQRLRALEQGIGEVDYEERGRRLMQLSISRYRNHFLTERSISKLPLGDGVAELLVADDGRVQQAIEQVANVQLLLNDEGDGLRLDGLDGVGREVARRAISRLGKKASARDEARADPAAWAQTIRDQLDREILTLGARAFNMLKVKRAHPEIVQLVGALNYRTSYTQNQWRHAVEAAFLSGLIAQELGLDLKLARRAALLHDIGKALTHKVEGSHAVIGAEIARRLGEDELVANAIGAHHLDEPMNSAYASLTAAADAMSGGRPGARREFAEGYTNRLHDLERIGVSFRGVDRAHAVHGGRELRVYVREDEISDDRAAELAGEIAARVSEELTFPGQIKVTTIRAFEAVSTAS